jgi:hypothetical protein
MQLTVPAFETWAWPWPLWTLHIAYLASGLTMAAHYLPLLRRAWRHPGATATAQSLLTWSVWTLCRGVAFVYGIYIVHDLIFLIVVGTDVLGRFALAALIVRARVIAVGLVVPDGRRSY